MRILGIDPGTRKMGYGLLEDHGEMMAVDWGVISLPASLPIETRLFQLHSHLLNMISIWLPDEMAVEEPFVGKGENQFVGPALAVGQAQALALIAAAGQSIPISRYSDIMNLFGQKSFEITRFRVLNFRSGLISPQCAV